MSAHHKASGYGTPILIYFSRFVYVFRKFLWVSTFLAVLLFLITNITCAVIIDKNSMASRDPPMAIVITRVVVNDALFIIYAIFLSISIYKVSKLPTNYQVLESQVI